MVRAILQDPEVYFRRDATAVVSLVAGSVDNGGEVIAAAARVNGYAVDVLRRARARQLSMRQTLRFPCRCTRDELYEARRAISRTMPWPRVCGDTGVRNVRLRCLWRIL